MYLIDPSDGIPVLFNSPEHSIREATEQEVAIFNDFWGMYYDRIEAGERSGEALDAEVRRTILTRHGLTDII